MTQQQGSSASGIPATGRAHFLIILSLILPVGATLAAAAMDWPLWAVILTWLVAINLTTMGLYRYDKSVASTGKYRIPEGVLWFWALIGGSPGALIAMYAPVEEKQKHKSSKFQFYCPFWIIVAVQILGLVALFYLLQNEILTLERIVGDP